MIISAETARMIKLHAGLTTNEVCGVIGRDGVYTPIKNIADEPDHSYAMDPDAQVWAWRELDPVAIVHSHPRNEAVPSMADVALACEPGMIYIIIGTDGLRGWAITSYGATEEPLVIGDVQPA